MVFNFSGNADFITVWTGDTGHEYKHRNRTKVDIADIESCELEIEISQQYGTLNNLDLFAGNKFAGLNGSDAATDRPVVEAIAANDCADWTKSEDHGQVQGPRHAGLQLPGHGIRPLLAGFAARRQPLYP